MEQREKIERFDWTLAFILFLLFIVSIIAISSSQTTGQYTVNFVKMQIVWYIVGIVIISCSLFFEPEQYRKLTWYLYGFGIFLLAVLLISPESIAETRNGAKSWFTIPGAGSIQPSEFMKTFYILAVSRIISGHHQKFIKKTIKTDFLLLGKIFLTLIPPLILILLQPDLGTGLVFLAITAGMVLVSGINWRILLSFFLTAFVLGASIIAIMLFYPNLLANYVDPYQFGRIYSWLDPYSYSSNEGFHLISSLQAIGSGEIFGKGYMGKEVYVMERHTDFIFSTVGEEFGFIGSSLVIILFFFLIYHIVRIALHSNSPFNSYVCAGVISMTAFHVFQNIGMTIQVLPITGIPLPFISYGGSSLMGNMLAMGIIFSIKFYHNKYMFNADTEE